MRESYIEREYCRRVKAAGGMAIKLTSLIGLPDRLIILPGLPAYLVEFKAPGEKPRKAQVFMISKLRALGIKVYVIDSITPLPTEGN